MASGHPSAFERAFENADPHGPILFAHAHVLLTRPKHFHRPSVERLGHRNGLADLIGAAAAPVAAAQKGGVNEDLVRRDAGLVGGPQQRELG